MKIKSLILAMVACAALFTACSNEDDVINKGGEDQKIENPAYANFAFAVPGDAFTKAAGNPNGGPDGNGNEEGSSEENNITSIKIYLFDQTSKELIQTLSLSRADFTPNTVNGATLYKTRKAQMVEVGDYFVHVILNQPSTGFGNLIAKAGETSGSNVNVLEKATLAVATKTGEYCAANKFMMTNADIQASTNVAVTEENTIANPAAVTVNVERMAAKIDFEATIDNSYAIKDENGNAGFGTVKFDAYKIINTRNGAFGLRRVGLDANNVTIGAPETGVALNTNYVIEPLFAQKATWSESVFTLNYSRKYNTYVAFRALNTKEDSKQILAYCLENTMPMEKQINGYSTGVIFRAKITLADGKYIGKLNSNGDLYRYGKKFYASLVDLDADFPNDVIGLKEATKDIADKESEEYKTAAEAYLKSINNRTTLYDFGVEFFIGGNCYYTYWLRHSNNGIADESAMMEFATVRNNIYRVAINSVAYVGDFTSGTPGAPNPEKPEEGQEDVDPSNPNPEIPGTVVPTPEPADPVVPIDPENPDESKDTYLDVTVQVKNWTIRDNGIDF